MKMVLLGFIEIFVAAACFVLIFRFTSSRNGLPTSWPLLGTAPAILVNIHQLHNWMTEILERNNCTFFRQGIWFTNSSSLITVDLANVHHIMSANFVNFPKGPKFKKIFDVLGDGIFNADSESWKLQRKATQGIMTHVKFQNFLVKITRDKIETGLIKVFDELAKSGVEADLQDLFQRLTFDLTCKLVTGFDPGCLSIDLPQVVFANALDDAEEAIYFRHIFPVWTWKLQSMLGIGMEEKMRIAKRNLDQTVAKYIQMKREELRKPSNDEKEKEDGGSDLLTSYILEDEKSGKKGDDKYLRDTILNLMLAGRDTTGSALTWFFYNLSKNPSAEAKIREEINSLIPNTGKDDFRVLKEKVVLDKMVYLHGAICESLRLYPPVPFQHKLPTRDDVLPSGHQVHANVKILFSLYAMGRMKSIWGDDCTKFRPERWISEKGGIKHEPSYKFLSFNAGPRTCLGKEVAFTQIKTVVASILKNYEVCVVEGQKVVPATSVILHMRHGLKVKINPINQTKRIK